MRYIITEGQYGLITERMELVSSFDDAIGNLSKVIHIPYGDFYLGTEGRPWFNFLVFDRKNRKELLKAIKDWKSNNNVDIFLSDENSLRTNNHRHGLVQYKEMKYSPYVKYDKISSQFENPDSIAIFITPKKEIVDTKDKVFYHSSLLPDLDKIGLKPISENMKYKNKLYFWDNLDVAHQYGINIAQDDYYIYKVNLGGYDVFKDTEERQNAYFIDLPVNPYRIELVGKFPKQDPSVRMEKEQIKKSVEEKIKKFDITYSKLLPYIEQVKESVDICESFDDESDYVSHIIDSAVEILFEEISEEFNSHFGWKVHDLCEDWFFDELRTEFENECY
jgi:hypothetical protein